MLLSLYEPWEVEEIACVRDYMMSRYEHLYKQHEDELVRFCERHEEVPGTATWLESRGKTAPPALLRDESMDSNACAR